MSQTGTDYIGNLNKRVEGRGGGARKWESVIPDWGKGSGSPWI